MEKEFVKGLVSICIPTYNGEKYITKTLESVLSQTYENIEVIISDDCSTDKVLEVVRGFDDKRIVIYENSKRQGLCGNWNAAVKRASGEFVKVVCQDDILYKSAVEKQVEAFNKYPDISCCIGNTTVIDHNGNVVMERNRFKKSKVVAGVKYARKSLLGRNIFSEPPNLMYRTKDFYSIGEYDVSLKYTPDWDYGIRLCEVGNIACISEKIMMFRLSDSSETSRLYNDGFKELMKDSDKMFYKFYKKEPINTGLFHRIIFYCCTRAFAIARNLVLKFKR